MNRRDFLGASAGLALASTGAHAQQPAQPAATQPTGRPPRVGLIGCGWYGKSDLLRLVQVANIEVTKLCDVDSRMLSRAADIVVERQRGRGRQQQRPQT